MLYWLLDLIYEAASKAQSFKITGVNERTLVSPHRWQNSNNFAGLASAEEPHSSDVRRVDWGEVLEGRSISQLLDGKLPGHRGTGAEGLLELKLNKHHKQGENLLSLYPGDNSAESCLNIS